jgi:hypothetical protein
VNKEQRNAWQREHRQRTANLHTKVYEKTPKGFLMRLYRNMKSRVEGVQKAKYHLYEGKQIHFSKEEFYDFALNSDTFKNLYNEYEESGFDRKLAPSIDRLDSSKGYSFDNIEWVTHSENSRRGAINRHANSLYS